MAKQYIPNAFLKIENSQIYAVFSWSNRQPELISTQSWLAILEIFIHQHDIQSAYQAFQQIQSNPRNQKITEAVEQYNSLICHQGLTLLRNEQLTILEKDFGSFFTEKEQFDLSHLSQLSPEVLLHLFAPFLPQKDLGEINTISDFMAIVCHLERIGLLSPAHQSLDWGDFKRTNPICQTFGFLRGQPVDRYYLDKFIQKIRPEIVGNILEIGATPQAKETYQLSPDSSYQVLNIEPFLGVDIVGDAHNVNLIKPESFDTILLFSVLEHCYAPWIVIENIYTWLKPGGKCFAMTPVSAKIHNVPQDYWRIMPDAFTWMLKNFSHHELQLCGNTMTVLADLYGISAAELTTEELDAYHPDHPVSIYFSATK
ncbi:MAG: methyltransferase domain-containing protein [Pseudanabaena sp. ELA607]|jgi:SAM-dependent methyltransferase